MKWWWLSFCDASLIEGTQFLGAAIVQAHNFLAAAQAAHTLGINPGGEIQGAEVPINVLFPASYRERLLTRAECEALDKEMDDYAKRKQ